MSVSDHSWFSSRLCILNQTKSSNLACAESISYVEIVLLALKMTTSHVVSDRDNGISDSTKSNSFNKRVKHMNPVYDLDPFNLNQLANSILCSVKLMVLSNISTNIA